MTIINFASGSPFAEDIPVGKGGRFVRGKVAHDLDAESGFPLWRQHSASNGTDVRPAQTVAGYPRGLLVGGIGTESDGYGSQHSGGAAYCNLDRARENVWVTDYYWFSRFGQGGDAAASLTFYHDTQAWDNARRAYYMARINLLTMEITGHSNGGAFSTIAAAGTAPVPGFNENKNDMTFVSLTTWVGPTGAASTTEFGRYGQLQIGAKVYDLTSFGTANYGNMQVGEPSNSFAGGSNPGIGITTPNPGEWGGIVLYRWARTIGDTLVTA